MFIFGLLLFSTTYFPALAEETAEELTGQQVKTMTVQQLADYYKIDVNAYITELKAQTNIPLVKPDDSFQLLHDNYGTEPSLARDIAAALAAQGKGDANALQNLEKERQTVTKSEKEYNFPLITAALLVLYFGSVIFVKLNKLLLNMQRKIWNILLALFFLASGLLGILLVLRISHGINIPLPFNMLFWHVETGIAFSIIAIFHFFWHLHYYKTIFKLK